MSTPPTAAAFSEKDFELLAQTLDGVPASRRELFLTKLVILLVAGSHSSGALASCVDRAQRDLAL